MTRVQKIVQTFLENIKDMDILEAACGCAEFSICAAQQAVSVHCIDLTDSRLLPTFYECPNLTFQIMDAAKMDFPSESFDTVILYNAVAHLGAELEKITKECLRVLRPNGVLLVISSFKMDKGVICQDLIPFLEREGVNWSNKTVSAFYCLEIRPH